jgi:predicted DsbA family dithiol-disulfide isomerase
MEELFAAYFENEQDITDLEVLTTCGIKAGLDRDEVIEWLNSDKGGNEVDREVWNATGQGISGVPSYTINEVYKVSGAQDSSVFLGLFEKANAVEHR